MLRNRSNDVCETVFGNDAVTSRKITASIQRSGQKNNDHWRSVSPTCRTKISMLHARAF